MGQICLSAKRFFVHYSIVDQFVELLLIGLKNHSTAPLYAPEAYKKLREQLIEGINSGAQLIKGDINKLKKEESDIFVLRVEDKYSPLLTEEVFGPVFVIKSYRSDSEVLDLINSSKYGLGCSIYNLELETAEYMANNAETGMVFVNSYTTSKSELPWGGVKASGYGRDSWKCGIEAFSNIKTVKYSLK